MSDIFSIEPGASILIIGLGRSGLATLDVLRKSGASLFATDEKPREQLHEAIAAASALGAQYVDPGEIPTILDRVTWAVLSPGVPPTSPVVRALDRANVPVTGEIEVAYRLCAAPIAAITGTKGKSTTTALLGHLLRESGLAVRVGGNIGNPLVGEVGDAGPDSWVVAEVSSFQLETIRSFRPRVAVILNLAPDHLDRYHSMDEYAEAKYRIFANQSMNDWFVGNLDDPRVAMLHWRHGTPRVQARQLWYSLGGVDGATMYLRDGIVTYAPITGDPRPIALLPRAELPLVGEHNVQNAMAALLAALAIGCSPSALREGLRSFVPMAHRLQSVGEIDGILYVDDSKATNPAATIAALHSFDRPIVLIAGGRSKGTSFEALGAEIRARVKALVVIGESAAEIARAAAIARVVRAESMDDAVRRARELASPGDVVLLSPGCASFDMFASAEDRGERFGEAVMPATEHAGA